MSSNPVDQSSHSDSAAASGQPPSRTASPRHYGRYALIALVVIAILLFLGWLPRHKRDKQVAARQKQTKSTLPVVQVVTAYRGTATQQLILPGTVTPVSTTHIYSRAAGYLKALYVNLGQTVHRGQLLALIDSPDLQATVVQQDALLQASKGALGTAKSQLELQQATDNRVHTLALHGVLSQQDDDVALAALKAATAGVRSAEDNVNAAKGAAQRAAAMLTFDQVRAPIDGTITACNVEIGSLVSPSGAAEGMTPTPNRTGGPPTGGAQGGELFQIANIYNLRVFVTVPEENALNMQTGQPATLTFAELPAETFNGRVLHSSDSLSQQTRAILLEIQIDDPHHRLRPGMFASVQLRFKAPQPGILVSGDSVITRAQGEFVAVVQGDIVHLKQVHVGRDMGTELYVTSGLNDGDKVIVNTTEAVQEGAHVQVTTAPKGQEK